MSCYFFPSCHRAETITVIRWPCPLSFQLPDILQLAALQPARKAKIKAAAETKFSNLMFSRKGRKKPNVVLATASHLLLPPQAGE